VTERAHTDGAPRTTPDPYPAGVGHPVNDYRMIVAYTGSIFGY